MATPEGPKRVWLWPALITVLVLCAFALRWYYVSTAMVVHPVRGDAVQYHAYAWNLTHHDIFSNARPGAAHVAPDNYRDPGYPLFLSLWMRLLGDGPAWYAAVLLSQALLGALTVGLGAALGRRWLKPGWALAAGCLMALWPHSITGASFLLTETLVGFLIALGLWMTAGALARSRLWTTALAGLVLSAAALTNAVLLPFGVILAVVLAARKNVPRRLLLTLAISSVVLPGAWALRNMQLPASASSSSDRAYQNLVQGSWPAYHRAWRTMMQTDSANSRHTLAKIKQEYTLMRQSPARGLNAIFHRMRRRPWHFLAWYTVRKPIDLWGWNIQIGQGDIYTFPTANSPFQNNAFYRVVAALCHSINGLVMLLALVGVMLILLRRHSRPALRQPAADAVACLLVYITFVYTTLQAEPRYSIPFRAFEFLVAITALAWIVRSIAAYRRRVRKNDGKAPRLRHTQLTVTSDPQ